MRLVVHGLILLPWINVVTVHFVKGDICFQKYDDVDTGEFRIWIF